MLSIDSLDNTTNKIIEIYNNLLEDEDENFNNNNFQNSTIINSPNIKRRDLIHEFMLRNYPPPAILQPTNHLTYLQNLQQNSFDVMMNCNEFYDNELNDINITTNIVTNNKNDGIIIDNDELKENHPQLLFEIEMEEHEDDHESDQDKDDFAKFILNESLLLQQRSKEIDTSECNLNSSRSQLLPPLNGVVRTTRINDSECRLIGNVNPNIAKTWQQLNSNLNSTSSSSYNKINKKYFNKKLFTRSISNNSDESEKILFYQQVYENKDNFQVNKVKYSREDLSIEEDEVGREEEQNNSIESYFDSIENDVPINDDDDINADHNELQFNYDDNDEFSDEEQFNDNTGLNNDEIDNIISHSNQEGGEQMADINSFDRKKYIYNNWSLENDSYV